MSESESEVEIYHRVNRLKLKAGAGVHDGPGFIDPHAVERAHTVIEKKESLYVHEVEKELITIEQSWDQARNAGDKQKQQAAMEKLYHHANHIKDLASTFGYELMQHFALSLREFVEKIDVEKKEHHIIVQAHIDVMWVVYHENIKDQGGPVAQELKQIVARAIEKHS